MTGKTIYRGEGLVKRWGDSSSALRTVTIQLQEDDPLSRHPFFGFEGRPVAVVVMELDETMGGAPTRKDGDSVNTAPFAPPAKPGPQPSLTTGPAGGAAQTQSASAAPPKPNSQIATMMAKNADFRVYSGTFSEEEALHFIRKRCGVDSRATLNDDENAARAFRLLRNGFSNWKQGVRTQ